MAKIIPWSQFEAEYAAIFSGGKGAPAKTFRMALGALIIKERLGGSDRENPYKMLLVVSEVYRQQLWLRENEEYRGQDS